MRSPMVTRNVLSATVGARSTRSTASARSTRRARRTAATSRREPRDVARHPRRLAEQRRQVHVDRRVAEQRVAHLEAAHRLSRRRRRRTGSARARRGARNRSRRVRRDRQDVPLLRLVAPDLARRHPRLFVRRRAQVDARAAAGAVRDLGQRVRQAARADVVDREDRDCAGPSAQQRSITSCARRWISALPRWTESKSRSAVFVPVVIDEADPPPMPMSMPGPPNWISSEPAGTSALCACSAWMLPDAAGQHDRLVIAAHDAGRRLLERAEVAGEVRPAELVVERGGADRARRS